MRIWRGVGRIVRERVRRRAVRRNACRAYRCRRSCSRPPPDDTYHFVGTARAIGHAASLRHVLSPKTKIVEWRLLVDAVVLAEQVVVEPPELKSSRLDARLRPEFAGDVVDAFVRARSHHEPNERMVRHGEQRIRVVDRTARVVVPAGDLQHRRADLRDVRRDGVRAPVRVERGVREPTIPQRHVAAAESLRQVDQRQMRERRPDVEIRRVLQRARAHEARPSRR